MEGEIARCSRCGGPLKRVTAVRFNEDGSLLRHDYDCTDKEHRSYLYVASSWRNPYYPSVIERLRAEGVDHYDFRNPAAGNYGFSGAQVSRELGYGEDGWKAPPSGKAALAMLHHDLATEGFTLDINALLRATGGLLVMPCGRSAHLELGYLAGRGKRTVVLLDENSEVDLMWRLADLVTDSLGEAIEYLVP